MEKLPKLEVTKFGNYSTFGSQKPLCDGKVKDKVKIKIKPGS